MDLTKIREFIIMIISCGVLSIVPAFLLSNVIAYYFRVGGVYFEGIRVVLLLSIAIVLFGLAYYLQESYSRIVIAFRNFGVMVVLYSVLIIPIVLSSSADLLFTIVFFGVVPSLVGVGIIVVSNKLLKLINKNDEN